MTPKARNGPLEQMRILLVARRFARRERIQALNQLRHLAFCAPEPIGPGATITTRPGFGWPLTTSNAMWFSNVV